MKKIILSTIIILLSFPLSSRADEPTASTSNVPVGMETVTVKGINLVIPKGSKVKVDGAQVIVEDYAEFMGRKFEDFDERLKKVEDRLEQLNKDKKN